MTELLGALSDPVVFVLASLIGAFIALAVGMFLGQQLAAWREARRSARVSLRALEMAMRRQAAEAGGRVRVSPREPLPEVKWRALTERAAGERRRPVFDPTDPDDPRR